MDVTVTRLGPPDRELARRLFTLMAEWFAEAHGPLSDAYLDRLLARSDFWVVAALEGPDPLGGLTAHALPMTKDESTELFIYDIAVRPDRQRQGIGRALVAALRRAASLKQIHDAFVPADADDAQALEFYRALGGQPAAVTIFTFSDR